MRVQPVRTTLTVAAVTLLFGACTGSPAPAGSVAIPTRAAIPAASAATGDGNAATSTGGGTGGAASACGLLTADEIKQAVGFAVGPGTQQDSDGQSDCEWAGTGSDTDGVGLTVATYDDFVWQTMSSSSLAKPVSGIGDAAFKGYPHNGDLMIKAKGYQITMAIIDFNAQQGAIDAGDLAMAKLVLPRL